MRGRDLSAPLKAKLAVSKIIRDDKHDVRFLGTNRELGGREAHHHQSEHLNNESSHTFFHLLLAEHQKCGAVLVAVASSALFAINSL